MPTCVSFFLTVSTLLVSSLSSECSGPRGHKERLAETEGKGEAKGVVQWTGWKVVVVVVGSCGHDSC